MNVQTYRGITRFQTGQAVSYQTGLGVGRGTIVGEPRLAKDGGVIYDVRTRTGNQKAFREDRLDSVD